MKEIFPHTVAEKQKLVGFKSKVGLFCALHLESHGYEPIRLWTQPIEVAISGMRKWPSRTPKNDNLNGDLAILSQSTETHYYEFDNLGALEAFCHFYNGKAIAFNPDEAWCEEDGIQKSIEDDHSLADTEKEALIMARRGQGKFRERVLAIEKTCRLTNVGSANFLIASHIWPWRKCESKQQRLDGNNGLMLTPSADFLFDRGYISFADNGQLLLSESLDLDVFKALGPSKTSLKNSKAFLPEQCSYLRKHRELHSIINLA